MRIFLVGATGVIGRALVPRLLERGDSVVALVRSRERATAIDRPGVTLVDGDLLTIGESGLAGALDGCDAALHMATALRPGSPGLGTTNTNAALRIEGTSVLLAAVLRAGIARFVQQSIVMAYPDGRDDWLDESTPFDTSGARAETSRPVAEMERMVRALDPRTAAWSILRGGPFVGPATFQDGAIERLRAGTERVPGDGLNWISPVHVEDYAQAVALATHSPAAAGRVLHVTDGPIRNGDYLDRLAERLGVTHPPLDLNAAAPRSCRCSNRAAQEVLGWEPIHGIWPDLAGSAESTRG